MSTPAHKQTDPTKAPGQIKTLGDYVQKVHQGETFGGIDFDSDEPLACDPNRPAGEACESCQ